MYSVLRVEHLFNQLFIILVLNQDVAKKGSKAQFFFVCIKLTNWHGCSVCKCNSIHLLFTLLSLRSHLFSSLSDFFKLLITLSSAVMLDPKSSQPNLTDCSINANFGFLCFYLNVGLTLSVSLQFVLLIHLLHCGSLFRYLI